MVEIKETEPKKKRRSRSLPFQIVLVLVVLALIWFSFGQNVLKKTVESGMPVTFDGMELLSTIEGEEALSQVSQMHGVDINLVSAYIAQYADTTREATVWVGKAENDDDAVRLLNRMVGAIADGNPSFSNLRRLTISRGYTDIDVFQVDGPGGSRHFFYLSAENHAAIVWVAVNSDDTLPVIEQAVRTF